MNMMTLEGLRIEQGSAAAQDYETRALAQGRDFVANVKAILPSIAQRRQETERLGRVNDTTMRELIDVGFFRTFTPLQYGGLEIDPASFFEALIDLAQVDSSAAWVTGQLNIHSIMTALMDPQFQDEFWGQDPNARASSSFAPLGKVEVVEGGYVLDGTWTFSSGVDFASWVILGGGTRSFLVPSTDFSIDHSSWDVHGLQGTGSKAVTLNKVFVPEYRCFKYLDNYHGTNPGWKTNHRPLYHLSFPGLFFSTATNTAIGTALDGVYTFLAQSRERRTRQGTGDPIMGNPFLQLKLAKAISRVEDLRERHLRNWREAFHKACSGEPISATERLRVRFEAAEANGTCFDVIHDLWPMAGAAASFKTNHLHTVYRHLMAARNHGTAGIELAAGAYMQALFGSLPQMTPEKLNMGTLIYYR